MTLAFRVEGWLGRQDSPDPAEVTLGGLHVSGPNSVCLTDVVDTIVGARRSHVYVPVSEIATWLVSRWWRLRYEAIPREGIAPSIDWRVAHDLRTADSAYELPPLWLWGDGQSVSIRSMPWSGRSKLQYERATSFEVPGSNFDTAVEDVVRVAADRLRESGVRDHQLDQLWEELQGERANATTALLCRLQARAGVDPGDRDEAWIARLATLAASAGSTAGEEVAATLPLLHDLDAAADAVDKLRHGPANARLSFAPEPCTVSSTEPPWQAGARAAHALRASVGLDEREVIEDDDLDALLEITGALPQERRFRDLGGGWFDDARRLHIALPTPIRTGQRFFLARVLGSACFSSSDDRLLAVTGANTAYQKANRSFAMEFLCPWPRLDRYTAEVGVDDEGIELAAAHFKVSQLAVRSALVNRGKIGRDRLEA